MYHARELRWGIFLLALVALLLLLVFTLRSPISLPSEGAPCLGIPVVSLTEVENTLLCARDYDDCFLYNGEKAAIDTASKTIYIPQTIGETTTRDQLEGALTLSVSNRQLYFLQDTAFENLSQAVSQGHNFSLAVACGRHYHIYSVVFTTLPVIRIDAQNQQEQENGFFRYWGQMCLWDASTGTPVSSSLSYHPRGTSSLYKVKKSWKLSLKTNEMKNNHLSLLDMGADDDWILNAMSVDDTYLKEMFMTNVWNSIAENSPWDHPMSSFQYVELVMDGSYYGIYLLQRRVDQKFLGLSEEDILVKGTAADDPVPSTTYEIKYTPLSNGETYALMEDLFYLTDVSMVDIDNFLDVNVLLQLGSLGDNCHYKNMFYCLEKGESGYSLSMIPWDTDMALGVCWVVDHLDYDYSLSMNLMRIRREYDSMRSLYPDLDQRLSTRWKELRQGPLSNERLTQMLESQIQELTQSGVCARNAQRWESFSGGADTQESVVRFVQERVKLLDAYYE